MARPTMRRLSPLALALPIWLVSALGATVPASAQETPTAALTLLSQTSWNCPYAVDLRQPTPSGLTCQTGRELVIRFRAQNTGTTPLDQLAIGVSLYSRILSRSAYEDSLTTDPSVILKSDTLVREGVIQAGGTRDFEVSMVLKNGLDPAHSGVYPVKVDLRSGVTSVAAIRTPAIFLVREPEIPLTLSWTIVLSHPITFAPDGTFTDTSLETSLAPGGRLSGQIRALRDLVADPTAPPVGVAISPVLLTQLGRMRGGYSVVDEDGTMRDVPAGQGGSELASRALDDLRAVAAAPSVEVTTLPFSAPEIPSLYGGGLGRDVGIQLERGRAVASSLIQADPPEQILRPPGAALDDETLRGLAGVGVGTLIVGPTTVDLPPQPLGFAGPATTALGDGAVTAIVPEPSTDAVMTSVAQADPVRGAQVVLGELTTIWQEAPGETRSVALVLGEDAPAPLPGPFFPPLVRGVAGAPWLTPAKAEAFVEAFPSTEKLELANPSLRQFPGRYVVALKQARRRAQTLRSMLPDTSIEPERLETMLLLAEARQFLTSTSTDDGLAFIASVRNSVKETVDGLSLDTVSTVALSSDSGGIPVTVSNAGQQSLNVFVGLVAPQLRNAPSELVRLGPGQSETVRLKARLRSTGRFPVQVQMTAPDGRPIEDRTLIVRSTAYNRIALLITIGAALMLAAVWARRFLPRRTT
jgi:Family of unknown function (DUF6049)